MARNNPENPIELSYAGAVGEVVANASQNALHDKTAFETLINNGKSELAKTLREWLDSFIQTIKKALESVKRHSQEYKMLIALDADMKELQRLFNEGLVAKESDTAQSEDTTAKTADIKYLIRHNEHNVPYVVIEGDYFEGIGLDERRKMLKKNLSKKFPNGINIGNNIISVNQKTREELVHSKNTRYYRENDLQKYVDKLNAANNADEILKASRDFINEAPLHIRKDNIIDFGRGKVLFQVIDTKNTREYLADVIVAHSKGGVDFLYDIVNLSETKITEAGTTRNSSNKTTYSDRSPSSVNNSVSNFAENVKENSESEKSSYRENTPTNREILTDALLNAEYLSAEDKNRLQIYQKKIDKLNALQNELGEVKKQIKDISFTKGTDRTQLPGLIAKSDSLSKKITLADKSLVRVEAMKPIQNIMNQITKEQMRKGKAELREYKQERKATAEKRKGLASIESNVSDLIKWINNPKQNKSIPTELQGAVLELLSVLNLESGVGD